MGVTNLVLIFFLSLVTRCIPLEKAIEKSSFDSYKIYHSSKVYY